MGAAIKGFVAKAGGMSGLLAGPWGIAIGIGASLILGKVAERKAKSAPSVSFGTELNLSGDPNDVGAICYGRAWTGGTLRYRNTTGVNNKDLYLVIVLAGHACEGVESVRADTDTLTLDGSGNVTSPAKWAGLMNVRFYLGSDSQTADSTLDSTFSDWTTNHRLCGRTYAIVKLTFDEENLRSVPNFRFLVKGRKVYDARLDSTNGGSGSHRLNTESTWAWSENALLCANDFHRGVMVNGIRVAGPGITRFSWPNVIAEANVCDENVALDAGGNENRYTTNGFIDPRQTHEEISEQFEQAFAGDFLFSDGAWRYFAGAYRAPSLSLTADHFVGPLRMVVHKSESDRRDTATGRYASLAAEGTQVNYTPFSLSTTTVGEERNQTIDFPLVNDATDAYPTTHDGGARAQRIAKLLLERDEAGKLITCTTNLYGWRAVPGESISVTHAAFGLSSQTMRVMDVQLRPFQDGDRTGLVVDLTLGAGPSSIYSWAAEEVAIGAAPALPMETVPSTFVTRARIYQRAASPPTLPSATVTFTFSTGGMTGLNNGWTASIPSGSNPLYISEATAFGQGTTDDIASGEWASPVILVENGATGATGSTGATGADGINSATVFLYQRNNTGSAPSVPGSTTTYTFSSGVLSGTLGSWTQTVPAASSGRYLFVTTATALSTTSTDTIGTGEWATVRLMAKDGDDAWTPVLSSSMTRLGGTFTKTGATDGAWDAGFYSVEGFQRCAVGGSPAQTNKGIMLALNTDPATDNNYTSLDYAWYLDGGGDCHIYESGTPITTVGSYSAVDQFTIVSDGDKIRWYQNDVLKRTTAASGTFYADSSFLHTGAALNSVTFGPIESVGNNQIDPDAVDTPQLADAAATDIGSSYEVGPVNASAFDNTDKASVVSVSFTIEDASCELEITASGRMMATHSASGGTLAYSVGLYYAVNGSGSNLVSQVTNAVLNTWVPFGLTGSVGGFSPGDLIDMYLVAVATESGGAEVADHEVRDCALTMAQVKR